ncbi:MAG: recombinase family protein [Thaumarchaeota archaeon]|nr:recombinase family protein [Nitrososphaerota archaeon]
MRVSREGEDPGNQVRAIAEWAARSGVEVLSYYVDADVSGAQDLGTGRSTGRCWRPPGP